MTDVHLFNGFMNPFGGSEQETLALSAQLAPLAGVRCWATSSRAHRELMGQHGIRSLHWSGGSFPRTGNFVFLGADWRRWRWSFVARPRRLIYVYNTYHPKTFAFVRRRRWWSRWPNAELVFISEFQRRMLGVDATVHPSPIDIARFAPMHEPSRDDASPVVGRLSRDLPDKHDPRDLALYRALADQGIRIRIQGGTCLRAQGLAHPNIELLPEGREPAERFLRSLDVFLYRSGTHVETFGRVVLEAMACGLPVVAHAHGGYADHVRDGVNGCLFESIDEARAELDRLLNDAGLRRRFGLAARSTVEALYAPERMRERARFYVD